MPDKSTIEGFRSTVEDRFPGLPSFVRQIEGTEVSGHVGDIFDHWAPEISGHKQIDFDLGRRHCRSAIAYARQIGTATFLLYVVMTMRDRPIGDIEEGFIYELSLKALVGAAPPVVEDSVLEEIAKDGTDIRDMRWHEGFMAGAIDGARNSNGLEFYDYVLTLLSARAWVGAAIYMLAGAAINGSAN